MNNRINFDDDNDLDEVPITADFVVATMCFSRLTVDGKRIYLMDLADDGRQFPRITEDWHQAKQFHRHLDGMKWFDSLSEHIRWTMFLAHWEFFQVETRTICDYFNPTDEEMDAWKIS
jgi:hypothetical protein